MKKNEILKNLFFIERGYLNANHFVYRSESPILIDTGYIADFSETENLITNLGVHLSDVSLIINTHTHCDHIGGNHIYKETVDLYFNGEYELKYHEIMKTFLERAIVKRNGDQLYTTVKP